MPDVMAGKYGKLLMNLSNMLNAALGPETDSGELKSRLKSEAVAIYAAAGITWRDVSSKDPRRQSLMKIVEVDGADKGMASTTQSLARCQSLETDYLNGEIVLLARLLGQTAPLNEALCRLAADFALQGAAPGQMSVQGLTRLLDDAAAKAVQSG